MQIKNCNSKMGTAIKKDKTLARDWIKSLKCGKSSETKPKTDNIDLPMGRVTGQSVSDDEFQKRVRGL
jgi:hypothetical protein